MNAITSPRFSSACSKERQSEHHHLSQVLFHAVYSCMILFWNYHHLKEYQRFFINRQSRFDPRIWPLRAHRSHIGTPTCSFIKSVRSVMYESSMLSYSSTSTTGASSGYLAGRQNWSTQLAVKQTANIKATEQS